MGQVPITVVVSAGREPSLLERCLAAVLAEPGSGVEQVLVAAREDDPEGARVCESWARRDARVSAIHSRRRRRGARLNEAASLASGYWLYFLDGEAEILPGSFAALQSAIGERPAARAVTGPVLPEDGGLPETAADAALAPLLGDGNLAVDKTTFLAHAFDEDADCGEEALLLARLRLAGIVVARESGMRARRGRDRAWGPSARRAWRGGRARARQTLALPPEAREPAPDLTCLARRLPEVGVLILAYGLGFAAELAAAAGRRAAPRGPSAALADWAAGRPLAGALRPLFAFYYEAAAASVRFWAWASRQPVSELRVHRGFSGEDWRPGVSDIDFAAVWNDPGADSEPAALERWARGYARLRRVFPMLGEAALADEQSWRRYRRDGDSRVRPPVADDAPWEAARRRLDLWTEQLHAYARLSRAFLDETAGTRRSRTVIKTFLDVIRHEGNGPTPTRDEISKRLDAQTARAAGLAEIGDEAGLAELCARAAALLDTRARGILGVLPAGEPEDELPENRLAAPQAAQDAEHAVARLSAAAARPETAVFDSAFGAWLVFPRLGEDAGFWPALRSFKRQDPAYAGTALPLTAPTLKLLAWSSYGEDPLKALSWRAAAPAALSGSGPLLRRHVVAVVGAAGLPPPPPKALAESLLRESAALLLLHWRGRLAGPDASSPFDLWTRLYGRALALRAWTEEETPSPSFPLEPLARRHARRHPEDAAWIEERVLGASALGDRRGDIRFLSRQTRELSKRLQAVRPAA